MATEKLTKTCLDCKKPTVSIDKRFYNTGNTDYFPDGKIPICKECCYIRWEKGGIDEFIKTLMMMDKPLLLDRFDGDYKTYVKNMNSIWYKERDYGNAARLRLGRALTSDRRALGVGDGTHAAHAGRHGGVRGRVVADHPI